MNTNQRVVEAEVVEDHRTLEGRPPIVQIPHRAAAAVEAVAATIEPMMPEVSEQLRGHARTVRTVATNAEGVVHAGRQLAGSVKSFTESPGVRGLFKKLGFEPGVRATRVERGERVARPARSAAPPVAGAAASRQQKP